MAGGDSQSGYWMNGYSAMNMPMYGPDRSKFASSPSGVAGRLGGGRGGAGGTVRRETVGQERLTGGEAAILGGESRSRQDVPAQYREAIRKYFTTED